MKIKVTYKPSYGMARYYPACDKAQALADLMRVKTFTPAYMQKIQQALGAEVIVSFPEVPGFEAPLVTFNA